MTADPKDAEIARLRMALAESEAAAEGALMILMQTQAERDAAVVEAEFFKGEVKLRNRIPSTNDTAADLQRALESTIAERDAALAQVAGAYADAATEAAVEVAANGASELAPFLRRKIRALTPSDALAALDRIKRQERAEGRKEGLREAAGIVESLFDHRGHIDRKRDVAAILAAAEKDAPHD